MAKRKYDRWWAAYHGDERIGIARTKTKLIQECLRRGLKPDQYYVGIIREHDPAPEEIERSLYEHDDFEPIPARRRPSVPVPKTRTKRQAQTSVKRGPMSRKTRRDRA